MNKHEDAEQPLHPAEPKAGASKRPYQKPAFRHEQVFETRALICGKIGGSQQQCQNNRRTS
jgi:hypothetical protein